MKSAIFHGASVKCCSKLACPTQASSQRHCPTLDRTATSLLQRATSYLLWSKFQWPSQTRTVFDTVPQSHSWKVSSPRQRSLPSTRVSKRRWYPQISSTRGRQLDPPSHAVESCCCATADIRVCSLSVGTPLHGENKSIVREIAVTTGIDRDTIHELLFTQSQQISSSNRPNTPLLLEMYTRQPDKLQTAFFSANTEV